MDCKKGTNLIIDQMIELLGKLHEDSYSKPLSIFNGSSIGQHFRHIIDFYGCLLNGVRDERIDYAKRERDLRVETEPLYAANWLRSLSLGIKTLSEESQLEVVADFSADLNEARPVVTSTVGRELMYAYDHAVHHLAMIKMGLKMESPSVEVGSSIGVAPSTLKHWQKRKDS